MKTEEALKFLQQNQPMPGDSEITDGQCEIFMAILNHFKHNPDSRCVSLLINSVNQNTGLGMYEYIGDALKAHDKDKVIEELILALLNANDSVKFRCCWWATDIDAWGLEEYIWPLIGGKNEDLSDAATYYIKLKNELE